MPVKKNLYIEDAQNGFYRMLDNLPSSTAAFGRLFLQKLSPSNWELEWFLPQWIGEPLQLDQKLIKILTRSNIYGLAYVCLSDDLEDREIDPAFLGESLVLKSFCYINFLRGYHQSFRECFIFWNFFDLFMDQWSDAIEKSLIYPSVTFDKYIENEYIALANRAAPIKICCVASCLAANERNLVPSLIKVLDHLNLAMVLFDHACDWIDDLEVGRYNALVHYASVQYQSPQDKELHKKFVYEELWREDAFLPYFSIIINSLNLAIAVLENMCFPDLLSYLLTFRKYLYEYREAMNKKARDELSKAVGNIF